MTVHVNEFNPSNSAAMYGVQTDPRKLKFNNIQSCIAVVLCVYNKVKVGIPTIKTLIGVHINTFNLGKGEAELKIAVARLKQHRTDEPFDIYLVGPYDTHYAASNLAKKLKSLNPREIKLANLPVNAGKAADQDIKVEAMGANLQISQRDCVKIEHGVLKDKYDPTKGGVAITKEQLAAGKHKNVNDKALKPWASITNFETLKFNILGNMKDRA